MTRLIPDWQLVPVGQLAAGIDEVGRGAWAGPVVAASVVLPHGLQLPWLADSKLVTPARRLVLDRTIRRQALDVGIGWVSASEVDEHGLSWAVRESGLRALAGMLTLVEVILLDGKHNYLVDDARARVIVKGDALVTPIAAASVVAKVARDRYMAGLAQALPGYAFGLHKGYGTAAHSAALRTLGVTPHHRLSYRPVKELADVSR